MVDNFFLLEEAFLKKHSELEHYLLSKYNFNLVEYENSIYSAIDNFYIFWNSIPGVSTIKAFESYLRPSRSNFDYECVELTSSVIFQAKLLYVIHFSLLFFVFVLMVNSHIRYVQESFRCMSVFIKINNELDNNLSSFSEIKKAGLIFAFILVVFTYSVVVWHGYIYYGSLFCILFSLNFCTLLGYAFIYNINIYVYIKGLLPGTSFIFNSVLDNITLSIFVSRLFLQLIRFIICAMVVFMFHEVSLLTLDCLLDFFFYQTYNNYNTNFINSVKIIIEYCDLIINFTAQYSIYIVSVLWLIPFLFTFVKKITKIYNK